MGTIAVAGTAHLSTGAHEVESVGDSPLEHSHRSRELASVPFAHSCTFSQDGNLFATKHGSDPKIRVWSVPPKKPWGQFALVVATFIAGMATLARWRHNRGRDMQFP